MISTIRLDGQWHFYADEKKKYTGFVPQDSVFTDTVRLPGTTAQNGKGKPNEKREDGFLTELYPYKGNAWYCREVQIPEKLHSKKMMLFLERTRVTTLWVNGQYIGTQDSLCTPHVYDISNFSHAHTLRLCICVDNTDYPAAGGHMTSPDTQTNWNGITGEVSLRFYDENCIISVKAEPDAQKRQVTLRMRTQGTVNILCAEGTWVGKEETEIPSQVLSVTRNADGEAVAVMPLGSDAPLWDEYNPVFARLMLRPFGSQDVTEVQF
ncbi:MAG: beta-glucuronidase, partial [Oscillospiraceae bacterium]|nr:beta-glucuronidase [Oscillospiraceae bacterium]